MCGYYKLEAYVRHLMDDPSAGSPFVVMLLKDLDAVDNPYRLLDAYVDATGFVYEGSRIMGAREMGAAQKRVAQAHASMFETLADMIDVFGSAVSNAEVFSASAEVIS